MTQTDFFQTSDGWKLWRFRYGWTDGDMTFSTDKAGHPIDRFGVRLAGEYVDSFAAPEFSEPSKHVWYGR